MSGSRNSKKTKRTESHLYRYPGLRDELTPEVDDRILPVRKADLNREIRCLSPTLLAACLAVTLFNEGLFCWW